MNHKKMVEEALVRLVDLSLERDRIEHEMCSLERASRAHLNLIEDQAERETMNAALEIFGPRIRITDLVKLCLQFSAQPMTVGQVKSFVMLFGHEAGSHSSILQKVHTTLLRLRNDVVSAGKNEGGFKTFRLLTMAERARDSGVADEPAKEAASKMERKIRFLLRRNAWYGRLTELLKASKARQRGQFGL